MKKIFQLTIINIFILFVLLSLIELIFRITGQKPNSNGIWFSNIQQVDTIVVYENFIADSNGIIKANPKWTWKDSVKVNSLGFRTMEVEQFLKIPQANRILLIGDSFAWGIGANPISNCFSDLIERNSRYSIFNTGIPTAGPNQYLWIAEHFIPKLKPQKVVVAFYMGNDLYPNDVALFPYCKNYHFTNAGPIQAWVDGCYIEDAQKALQLHLQNSRNSNIIKRELGGVFDFLVKNTVLGSKLFYVYITIKAEKPKKEAGFSYLKCLNKIKETAIEYDCEFSLFIIPYRCEEIDMNLFKGFNPLVPGGITIDSYHLPPDDHFNNQGHYQFSQFVLKNL